MLTHEIFDSYDIFEKDQKALLMKCTLISTPMMLWLLFFILSSIDTTFSVLNLAFYVLVYNIYISKIRQIEHILSFVYGLSTLILLSGLFVINKLF